MRIKPEQLKIGDIFYEGKYGVNIRMEVCSGVTFQNGKWEWAAISPTGDKVDYLITEGYEHYGPSIYSEPPYMRFDGDAYEN